jgi:aspartate carbamoyltransferase catalytic subunit
MATNLLSSTELSRPQVESLIEAADRHVATDGSIKIESLPVDTSRQGGLLFFESSTRTRIGFETAVWKLGIKAVSVYEPKVNDTMSAAESLSDTIRVLDPSVDFFGVRHPDADVFEQITPYTKKPIINCGSGNAEHPTQALIDAFGIWKHLGRLDGIEVTMLGALRYSRAARSLINLLSNFDEVSITAITEPSLQLTDDDLGLFRATGNNYRTATTTNWSGQEIVYSAGFPPKTPYGDFSQEIRDKYRITPEDVELMDKRTIIMNPLPRIDEIAPGVDEYQQAYYFRQNELALPMRMAIIEQFCL